MFVKYKNETHSLCSVKSLSQGEFFIIVELSIAGVGRKSTSRSLGYKVEGQEEMKNNRERVRETLILTFLLSLAAVHHYIVLAVLVTADATVLAPDTLTHNALQLDRRGKQGSHDLMQCSWHTMLS